ncbi:hypothetical protein QAD02_006816, partial [Eretmocerus hayati]
MASSPNELSLEEIRKFLLDNGGSARNQDLVKHFKKFLTDPESRVEARNRFKEYINTLATIKTEEGEKFLVLKRKFRQPTLDLSSPTLSSYAKLPTSPLATPDYSSPSTPTRLPPPYRSPPSAPISPVVNTSIPASRHPLEPPVGLPIVEAPIGLPLGIPIVEPPIGLPLGIPNIEPIAEESICVTPIRSTRNADSPSSIIASAVGPPVPPRRKSQDKIRMSNKENLFTERNRNESDSHKEDRPVPPPSPSNQLTPAEQLSVRERMQRFNRMASETDMPATRSPTSASTPPIKKRAEKGTEEDDRASVASQLDGKAREWLVKAAQGDYQALAKLAAEEPRLCRIK